MAIASVAAGVALASLLAASGMVTMWASRTGRTTRPLLLFGTLASLALILVVTLLREGLPAGWSPAGITVWSEDGWRRLSGSPLTSSQVMLNAALFAPAGFAWTSLSKRPYRVIAALAALSLLIECLQGLTLTGAPDVADLVANTTGAALGAGLATVLCWLRPGASGYGRPTRAAAVRMTAVGGALTTALAVAVVVGADARQRDLETELLASFAGTDLGDYSRWEARDQLDSRVFAAVSVFSDGARYGQQSVQVRYPATFFGLPRCVFVQWTPDGVEVRPSSGQPCTGLFTTMPTSAGV